MERGLGSDLPLDSSAPDKFAKGIHGTDRQPLGDHSGERQFIELFGFVQIQEPGKPARGSRRQATGISVRGKGVQLALLFDMSYD
jgi:hypothetical protein